MDPVSETPIGKIPNPAPDEAAVERGESAPLPRADRETGRVERTGAYMGPERRAQGYLIAEVLPASPALDRQTPEFDPPR